MANDTRSGASTGSSERVRRVVIDVGETFADAATLSQEDAKCDRIGECWWAGQDSNLQPDRYERPALTIELPARPGAPPEGKAQNARGGNAVSHERTGWRPRPSVRGRRAIDPALSRRASSASPPAVERPWARPQSRRRARRYRAAGPSPRRKCARHRARSRPSSACWRRQARR